MTIFEKIKDKFVQKELLKQKELQSHNLKEHEKIVDTNKRQSEIKEFESLFKDVRYERYSKFVDGLKNDLCENLINTIYFAKDKEEAMWLARSIVSQIKVLEEIKTPTSITFVFFPNKNHLNLASFNYINWALN
jgi:L-lactate utilization protein LutB